MLRGILVAMFVIWVAGCGKEPKLYHVSGKVTYRGEPLPAGVVYFDPDPMTNKGPQGYAMIKDGEFNTAAPGGKAILGGSYLVRIEGFDGKSGNELPLGKRLFAEFEQKVEFPKADSAHDFDVGDQKKPNF